MLTTNHDGGMNGFTKLFGSIVASTIWREDDKTRIVWITMLAIADRDGHVEASVPGLADLSRVSVDDARAAITKLLSPDLDSRSKEHEGKRIQEIDGGWLILNYLKYRNRLRSADRTEYLRLKKREERARNKRRVNIVNRVNPSQPIAEAEAEAEAEKYPPNPPEGGTGVVSCVDPLDIPKELRSGSFPDAWGRWMSYRRGVGKKPHNWATLFGTQLSWLKQFGGPEATEILEESMRNGWQGLFARKTAGNGATGMDKVIAQKELDRVFDKMKGIRNSYSEHQTWDDKDLITFRELKARAAELKATLGVKL